MASGPADMLAGADRVSAHYRALAASGTIRPDQAQIAVAERLDALNERLAERRLAAKRSALGWLFARAGAAAPVRGLYIHGAVGRGKTLLMNTFFEIAAPRRKRRAHFHEFMAEVHERIHAFRAALKAGTQRGDDPIAPVAAAIAAETRLLCLDEFSVEDIADAMILARLFGRLFAEGLVLVATSNTAPENLYRDGLNRPLFLPFVEVLRRHAEVVELDGPTDYRLEKLDQAQIYVSPLGPAARSALDAVWLSLTGVSQGAAASIRAKGREIRVPQAEKGVARFRFADLCEAPLGTGDYARIADAFHTVMIDDIPVLAEERRNEARRLINLIDTLYDARVKLVASAAAEPDRLYTATSGREAQAFQRTASRLVEMRSHDYLALPRRRPAVAEDA